MTVGYKDKLDLSSKYRTSPHYRPTVAEVFTATTSQRRSRIIYSNCSFRHSSPRPRRSLVCRPLLGACLTNTIPLIAWMGS